MSIMNSASLRMAEFLMKMAETAPSSENGELSEVFQHRTFTEGSAAERLNIMRRSSIAKYNSELDYPWDSYFGIDLSPHLAGQRVLDLGCFTGGRGVAWYERYKLAHLTGIDINPAYIQAAEKFAASKDAVADFHLAYGERLPFEPDTFDAILSFDVFEHVRDPRITLAECYRVLKPNGKLLVVFPSFYHPLEHHLSLVTRTPCMHYIFPGRVLINAYNRIIESRGQDSYWYRRSEPALDAWERGNTINGTTLVRFQKFISDGRGWRVVLHALPPIGSIGRGVAKKPRLWHRLLSAVGRPLVRIPALNEIFLHRIAFILQKV